MPEPVGNRRSFERLPGGGYLLNLIDDGVRMELRHLRREHHQLYAEVEVRCQWAGARQIACSDLNLSSQTARISRAKYCSERAQSRPGDFDWLGLIDEACARTIEAERKGSEVIVLDDAPELAVCDYDVCGLKVPSDAVSMFIAHGDSLKSLLLLFVLGNLAIMGHRVLYLDFEWTAERHRARKRRLFGTERLDSLRYQRVYAPLTLEVDNLRRYCDEQRIAFIGLDSVGLACDGKLADDDTAIRFHRALGNLPPTLCAAHVPKSALSPEGQNGAVGPFGSVFFSNLCRKSWLVKKQGGTDDVASVGVFPQKQNDGDRDRPIGLEFTFSGQQISVCPVDLAAVDGLAVHLPLAVRMIYLLKQGPLTYAEMAEELGAKVDSVSKASRRGSSFVQIVGTDGITRIALSSLSNVGRRTADNPLKGGGCPSGSVLSERTSPSTSETVVHSEQ